MACILENSELSPLATEANLVMEIEPFAASANCDSLRTRRSTCSSNFTSSLSERFSKPSPSNVLTSFVIVLEDSFSSESL